MPDGSALKPVPREHAFSAFEQIRAERRTRLMHIVETQLPGFLGQSRTADHLSLVLPALTKFLWQRIEQIVQDGAA